MSPTSLAEFDTGEIQLPPGEETANLAPYGFLPPPLRRADATGDIPVVDWDEPGLDILDPFSPAPCRYPECECDRDWPCGPPSIGPRHTYVRPAPSRRGRGRHRYPTLLVRAWRPMAGA